MYCQADAGAGGTAAEVDVPTSLLFAAGGGKSTTQGSEHILAGAGAAAAEVYGSTSLLFAAGGGESTTQGSEHILADFDQAHLHT